MGVNNKAVFGQEFVGNLYGRLQISACVATQVDGQILEVHLRQLCQCDEQFGIGVFAEVADADVACFLVQHIGCGDALRRNLAACYNELTNLLLTVTHDAQFHLRVLGTFQPMHGLFVG